MSIAPNDLWTLTFGRSQIDPEQLATAVEREVAGREMDYRTRLLIRDSMDALSNYWGSTRFDSWLTSSPAKGALEEIRRFSFDEPGFPSLSRRIMEPVRPEVVRQYLRDIGQRVTHSTRIHIGGSIALILTGVLSRSTEDIDVVDELPREIREQYDLLDRLTDEYGLRLTHFQSHYLPSGWADRVTSLGRFGRLDVFLIDPLDIFVGKLFGARTKDLSDLRALLPQLDKAKIAERLQSSGGALLQEAKLAEDARKNWYVLFGEALPA
jgi:hypothetical protein